ncbi:MAG: acetolactate decarboxylase [Acidaminococcaceae bacterium]|nr:acetolactate decarboxylase [Acidaminococcaceae bacterium]MDD4721339.1 acetolactate decarboxylase [Acidaminococcaceae bacterium]
MVKIFKRSVLFIIVFILFTVSASAKNLNSMYQVSTINALMQGVYDGDVTIKTLQEQGDFGIGTLNGLDGEMVVVDGKFYQVKSTGKIELLKAEMETPFANVINFKADKVGEIAWARNFSELEKQLDAIIEDKNYIYAIRIDGTFTGKTRSIPAKEQPYPSLMEAAKTQSVFDIQNTKGTIVGFWCPDYIQGINVTGYHLHFISADRKSGGHILSGAIRTGKVQVARVREFKMILPSSMAFQNAALNKDYSKELNIVEKSK